MATILTKNVTDKPKALVGTEGNTWVWTPDGWDLTHPADPTSNLADNGVDLDCELANIKLDPIKTALVIIDMQNMGLHRALDPPSAPPIYEAQDAILQYAIPAARKLGLQIIWLNWGLTEDDLATMPPAEVRVFAFDINTEKVDYGLGDRHGDPNDPANFLKCGERPNLTKLPGTDLGEIVLEDGSRVNAGRVMMRGTWNTALHGPLAAANTPAANICPSSPSDDCHLKICLKSTPRIEAVSAHQSFSQKPPPLSPWRRCTTPASPLQFKHLQQHPPLNNPTPL
ncbi:isochorismatase family protein [Metarhizium anisopliae]